MEGKKKAEMQRGQQVGGAALRKFRGSVLTPKQPPGYTPGYSGSTSGWNCRDPGSDRIGLRIFLFTIHSSSHFLDRKTTAATVYR